MTLNTVNREWQRHNFILTNLTKYLKTENLAWFKDYLRKLKRDAPSTKSNFPLL